MVRSRPWRTSGSQKWVGARPILSASARVTSVRGMWWVTWRMSHCPVSQVLVVLAKRSTAAAVA